MQLLINLFWLGLIIMLASLVFNIVLTAIMFVVSMIMAGAIWLFEYIFKRGKRL